MSMDTCYPCLRSVQGEGRGEGLATKPKILLSPFLIGANTKKDGGEFLSCYSAKPSPSLSQRERSIGQESLARRLRRTIGSLPAAAYLYNLPLAELRPIFIRPSADFTLAHAGSAGDCRIARYVALVQRFGCRAGADEGMESWGSSGKLAHALGATWFRRRNSFECAGEPS